MEFYFRKAVLNYKDTVYKIAYAGCGNSYDADDILQDVFFALCQGRNKFDSEEHLKAWLIRVTINRVKSHRRSFHVKKRAVIEENLQIYNSSNGMVEIFIFLWYHVLNKSEFLRK